MSILIKDLKNIIVDTIIEDFVKEGFEFRKSSFEVIKKVNKNTVRGYFLFYDYKPSRIEYQLNFYFTLQELEQQRNQLCKLLDIEYRRSYNILLLEADFNNDYKEEEVKKRLSYSHHICTNEECLREINITRKLLTDDFFPRLNTFLNLSEFQQFILADFERAVNLRIEYAGLLALGLMDKDSFVKLMDFVKVKKGYESLPSIHAERKRLEALEEMYLR